MEHNYRRLKIWQKSMELVCMIYKITQSFPKEEKFGLVSQMRRAAVSIPSNIAEGSCRNSEKHFSNFIQNSTGSLYELETQLIISQDQDFISKEQLDILTSDILKIDKMLYTFNNKVLKK